MFELKSSMSSRENYLRTIEMTYPEWIPCTVVINDATWNKYKENLKKIIIKFPSIFGEAAKEMSVFNDFGVRRRGKTYRDEWGCIWYHAQDGIAGQVKFHPLNDWKKIKNYKPPDPFNLKGPPQSSEPPRETWDEARKRVKKQKAEGALAYGYLPHGSLFQRVYYLRGFKEFLIDTVLNKHLLSQLVEIVVEYNMKIVEWWIENDVDVIGFGDDLGTQDRLTINPKVFREIFIPAYTRLFRTCREAGVHVHFHSDGHVMEVAQDMIKAGVSVLNIQDVINGLDRIHKELKGKVCIDLDIDRQRLLPFGTPNEIDEYIKNVTMLLGSRKGGLMLTAGIYADVPIENIEALLRSLEKYRDYGNLPE